LYRQSTKKELRRHIVLGALFCVGLCCAAVIAVLGFLSIVIPDSREDIESGFHPDFKIAEAEAKQHPHDNGYKLVYAFALYDKKRYAEAMEQLSLMLKDDKPSLEDMTQATAFLYAGKIMNAMGKPEQARKYLESLQAVYPPTPEVKYSMGNAAQEELNSIR
jgi:tetratricopeptide (TPR) repeat protein